MEMLGKDYTRCAGKAIGSGSPRGNDQGIVQGVRADACMGTWLCASHKKIKNKFRRGKVVMWSVVVGWQACKQPTTHPEVGTKFWGPSSDVNCLHGIGTKDRSGHVVKTFYGQ